MNLIHELKKNRALFIMAAPAVALLLIFNYLPMFGVVLAFKDFNYEKGILFSNWSGFSNFEFLFRTDAAFEITKLTIMYNMAFIIIGIVIPILLAIILNEIRNRMLAKVYQTVAIMPYFLSWVVVSFIFLAFLEPDKGYLNSVLKSFGIEPVFWYSEVKYWPGILIFANTWKNVGYSSIIYLAAITGISDEYYEAAILDGAGKLQQIYYITLPFLKPMMIILTILAVGKIFYADFGLFYQVPMNYGQLYSATNVIDVYVFNGLKTMGNIGMSAAANLYQSFVGFILVLGSNMIVRRIDKDYALF